MRRRPHAALLFALPTFALAACHDAPPPPGDTEPTAEVAQAQLTDLEAPPHFERVLPYDQGPGSVTFSPRGPEMPARGPNAVAVAPSGALLVLDQLGERIVAVGAEGEPLAVAEVQEDAHDLVASADGSFAAYSKVRSRAWFYGESGEPRGQMDVPRSFMFIQRLSLDAAGGLQLHSDGQNTISLGATDARVGETAARRARRYGAALLPSGEGVLLYAKGGSAELHVLAQPPRGSDRPTRVATHAIPGDVTAGRVIGAHGNTVCMRLEQVASTPAVRVARRATCLDAATGSVVFDQALPAPGIYAPQSELAMTGDRLGFIRPTKEGLEVAGWRVPSTDGEVQR